MDRRYWRIDGSASKGCGTLSDLTSVIFTAIGVVIGAALTGWFGIVVKRKKRVQDMRAEVYVDVLAWIWTRMPALQEKLGTKIPEASTEDRWPGDKSNFPETKEKITLPTHEAILSKQSTDPEAPFFVVLRSRVAAFASHDMARAFDRWVAAYKIILRATVNENENKNFPKHLVESSGAYSDECVRCALLALVTNDVSGTRKPNTWKWVKAWIKNSEKTVQYSACEIHSSLYRYSFTLRSTIAGGWDKLDGKPGCLTRAVAVCASEELRKG